MNETMNRAHIEVTAAIDIGAGSGAKLGIFDSQGKLMASGLVPCGEYERDHDRFTAQLAAALHKLTNGTITAAGIAAPGVIRAGMIHRIANLPFLKDCALQRKMELLLKAPVTVINDAAAGGVGEWLAVRHEMLYWPIGGGWGGAWIRANGSIKKGPKVCTEPGVTVRLWTSEVADILKTSGLQTAWLPQKKSFPAETFISASGRLQLLAAAKDANLKNDVLSSPIPNIRLTEHARAGNGSALEIDRAFGRLLALAAKPVLSNVAQNVPVSIGGGLANAADGFLQHMKKALLRYDLCNAIHISRVQQRGGQPALEGLAYIAKGKDNGR